MSNPAARSRQLSDLLCAIPAITVFAVALAAEAQKPAPEPVPPHGASPAVVRYDARPLVFEANHGQADPRVRFVAHATGYSLMLTDSAVVLALRRPADCGLAKQQPAGRPKPCVNFGGEPDLVQMKVGKGAAQSGEAAGREPEGEDPLPGRVNYFLGNDPAKWQAGVPTYARVRYREVYPGVDLVFYGNQRQLEYDFVVAPGADPSRIALDLSGAGSGDGSARIDAATGEVVIAAHSGELRLLRPVSYQIVEGRRVTVRSGFRLTAANEIGFTVGPHGRTLPLVIDPMLTYATYLGGSGNDVGNAIAVDGSGSVYVTGVTNSTDFPTLDPLQAKNGNATKGTSFVTKFTPDGSGLVYSTYLGGSGGDAGAGIAVDGDGNAYVSGNTSSIDFPMVNALQNTNNGAANDEPTVFVAKINPAGSALVFSTYLGGSGGDSAAGVAIDPARNVYVAGNTQSSDFPTQNPVQAANNCPGNCGAINCYGSNCGANAFLSKIDSSGSALVYSTYLGGGGNNNNYGGIGAVDFGAMGDFAGGIAVDAQGEAVVAGTTNSVDFPISDNALQAQNPTAILNGNGSGAYLFSSSGFVTKYKADGSGYVFSTYLGGGGFIISPCSQDYNVYGDTLSAVAVDTDGNVYATGSSWGGVPLVNAIQGFQGPETASDGTYATIGITNAFVTEYKADGSAYLFSTALGGHGSYSPCGESYYCYDDPACPTGFGNGGDGGARLAVDSAGSIYVAGTTSSSDFPVVNPFGGSITGGIFFAKMHSGGPLVYSSYFGSWIGGIATDGPGNVYISGATGGLPVTPGAFQTQPGGGGDAYVARISITGTPQRIVFNPPALTFGVPVDLTRQALASSGLPVQFTVASPQGGLYPFGQTTMKGNVLKPTWAGEVTIEAYQPGNSVYDGTATRVSVGVNPENLIVVAKNASMTYGRAVPALSYYPITIRVNDGWVSLAGAPGLLTTATEKSPAGTYPIDISQGTLTAGYQPEGPGTNTLPDPNYAFAFKSASLTIKRAELTVTAKNSTIHQGQPIQPELKYTITGFVNGDKRSVVRGKPILTTAARFNSPPGTYPIVVKQGNLSARNYKFKEVDGAIKIVK
jgi:hypothetical protein